MVEIKLSLTKGDGTREFRRFIIDLKHFDEDLIEILNEKINEIYPQAKLFKSKQIQYEDDIVGLVSIVDSTKEINELARDYQSRKQILRIFYKYFRSNEDQQQIKHFHVVCDGLSSPLFFSRFAHAVDLLLFSIEGCRQCPIIGIRYKCLECLDYDLCQKCSDDDQIHSHHVFAQIRRANQADVVKRIISERKSIENNDEERNDLEVIHRNLFEEDFVQINLQD